LDRDEKLRDVHDTRETREKLQALETERVRLENRRRQLDDEIAVLEARLQEQHRQLLGVEE
jgi:hypothetical protein